MDRLGFIYVFIQHCMYSVYTYTWTIWVDVQLYRFTYIKTLIKHTIEFE